MENKTVVSVSDLTAIEDVISEIEGHVWPTDDRSRLYALCAGANAALDHIKHAFNPDVVNVASKPALEYGDIATVEYALEELASGVSLDSAKTRGMYMAADQALERIKDAARPQRSQPRQFPEPGHILRSDIEILDRLCDAYDSLPGQYNMVSDWRILTNGYSLARKLRDIHAAQRETDKDQV